MLQQNNMKLLMETIDMIQGQQGEIIEIIKLQHEAIKNLQQTVTMLSELTIINIAKEED